MKDGRWVVFKDIDRASSEVLGVIKPLIESLHLGKWIGGCAEIDVPSKGRVVAAHGFALFATRSVTPQRKGGFPQASFFGAHKLYEVTVDPPSPVDLQSIVDMKFPRLAGVVASGLIRLWDSAKTVGSASSSRDIGIRDLEKLCARTSPLLSSHQPMDVDMETVAPLVAAIPNISIRAAIYIESRDVFFGAGANTTAGRAHLDALAAVIAEHLGIDDERRQFLLNTRVPDVRVEKDVNGRHTAVIAGETRLPAVVSRSLELTSSAARPFAMHGPAKVLLSRIASTISHCEPVLLTGETGTGKTSAVTHLASLLNRNLISLNLSQQTESSDLLGGFKPVSARVPGGALQEEFVELFGGTFSRRKNEKFESEARKAVTEGKWKRAVALWKESVRLARERIKSRTEDDDADPRYVRLWRFG